MPKVDIDVLERRVEELEQLLASTTAFTINLLAQSTDLYDVGEVKTFLDFEEPLLAPTGPLSEDIIQIFAEANGSASRLVVLDSNDGGGLRIGKDVTLDREQANFLDLGSGDSLRITSGSLWTNTIRETTSDYGVVVDLLKIRNGSLQFNNKVEIISSSGEISASTGFIIMAAQSGTTDDLIEISEGVTHRLLIIRTGIDDTITVKHADTGATAGNKIFLNDGVDLALVGANSDILTLIYDDSSGVVEDGWYELSRNVDGSVYTDAEAIVAIEGEPTLDLTGVVTIASGKSLGLLTNGSTGGIKFGVSGDVILYRGASNLLKLGASDTFVAEFLAIYNDSEGGTGMMTVRSIREVHTLSFATTSDTSINLPSGVKLIGVSFNVDTEIIDDAGDNTWSAEFHDGSSMQLLVSGAAAAQNTKVDTLVTSTTSLSDITDATTNIRFTPNGGSFSAGVIEVVIYYAQLTSLADA